MQPIDLGGARKLLDFSGGDDQMKSLGELQLKGAVALQNMLANPDINMGYLADEVGMGKTYIALGVVAMMRYFNPSYRVLYLCPSRNVQDKWYGRELPNFVKSNVLTSNFKIRTPQGASGAPSVSCGNIDELIQAASTGYYGDVFVRISSFSMAMGDDDAALERHFHVLRELVPEAVLGKINRNKEGIKKAYARALNYLLPTFDLVVIDEAHNLKHPFQSSARNLALSRILGFNSEPGENYQCRVKSALLLSATPFDVNPMHLYNQLNLVGRTSLMPGEELWEDKDLLKGQLAKFMVRRLNVLDIKEKPHTRNMYRREWRKGDKAEIGFESDEHKLITALVQKHIGDELNRAGGNPSFQMGMLASFESYAQTTRSGPVEFDGEKKPDTSSDAQDRHLIGVIRDSFVEEGFGKSLPHPKMDQVSRDAAKLTLQDGRKQLIFVRRVKSVAELKQKLDDEYDQWIKHHIGLELESSPKQRDLIALVWTAYESARKRRDGDISGGDTPSGKESDAERLPPKNDTIFNWFFRGELPKELDEVFPKKYSWAVPENIKNSLTSRSSANVLLFEINWAGWVAKSLFKLTLEQLVSGMGEERVKEVVELAPGVSGEDRLSEFLSVQCAFLEHVYDKTPVKTEIQQIVQYLKPLIRTGSHPPKDALKLLFSSTIFSQLAEQGLSNRIFSNIDKIKEGIEGGSLNIFEKIRRVDVHRQLLAQSFRSGHPFVDLYLSRLSLGSGDLNDARREQWINIICSMLKKQMQQKGFSTARELSLLNDNLDLVIKNNLPSVYTRTQEELSRWLRQQLYPVSPIIGATGETSSNRSVQARKFRMPGYPLVLVSTDVFQEGEDLHTFCDSVIHYGLSSSAVSIEQKTGRVDRVGAYAHRRLQKLKDGEEISDEDYIQVSFPFVKQSIESIQVRTLCTNLNRFLASLHDIGEKGKSMNESVDPSRELSSRNEIPDQLLDFLFSPYAAEVSDKPNKKLQNGIDKDTEVREKAIKHIADVLHTVDVIQKSDQRYYVNIAGLGNLDLDVQLDSARSCGEILLRVTANSSQMAGSSHIMTSSQLTKKWLIEEQARLYQQSLYRTYAIRVTDGYQICKDAEMLVGGPLITQKEDVAGLFRRFSKGFTASDHSSTFENSAPDIDKAKVVGYLTESFRWCGSISINKRSHSMALIFNFDNDSRRRHCIDVNVRDGYFYFEAMVANEKRVRSFSRDKLLRCTWLRNRNIDLVGFIARPDGCLVARAFHPAQSIGFEEFIFTAYLLAVEADRMEYLISEHDEY